MEWLRDLLLALVDLYRESLSAPPRVLGAAWGLGVVSALVFYVLLAIARFFIATRRIADPRTLKVKITNDEGVIRVSSSTIERFGLTRTPDQRVIVTGLKKRGAKKYARLSSMIEHLSWRADHNLAPDTLEISESALNKLFRGQAIKDGEPLSFSLRLYRLTGFADYWMNPDPKTRFSNRFAVYLAALVFLVQLALDRGY